MVKDSFKHSGTPDSRISDADMLDNVQRMTLNYFQDFAHAQSGMIRERSNETTAHDKNTVTTGGTGFGIMAMIAGVSRGWIAREDLCAEVDKITTFLSTADQWHGVFPHFLNAETGKVIPFSSKDDGADLVETSFLMMGLLTARQFFDADTPAEKKLREKITTLWENVDWTAHVKDGDLYWHWSPQHGFEMNLPIEGWNEALVTHIMAQASPTHAVATDLYHQGWCGGTDFKNNDSHDPPLGPAGGGPMFLSQYSFLGLCPTGLQDAHADYGTQVTAHAKRQHQHCIDNPGGFKNYDAKCWGLSSSEDPAGYDAHHILNDNGTITPTAALACMPFTPRESMAALRYFYEERGDDLFTPYGFVDAFNDQQGWRADTHLAIDQAPIVVMLENHRSGLLWRLFMQCPDMQQGLKKLGFRSPFLHENAPTAPKPAAFDKKPPKN